LSCVSRFHRHHSMHHEVSMRPLLRVSTRASAAVLLLVCSTVVHASPIVLDFSGIGSGANLKQFYNGGPGTHGNGPNYCIGFLSGGVGNQCYQSAFSPLPCLPDPPAFVPVGGFPCFLPTPVECTTMNIASGFTTSMHFQYLSPESSMALAIFSDIDATG